MVFVLHIQTPYQKEAYKSACGTFLLELIAWEHLLVEANVMTVCLFLKADGSKRQQLCSFTTFQMLLTSEKNLDALWEVSGFKDLKAGKEINAVFLSAHTIKCGKYSVPFRKLLSISFLCNKKSSVKKASQPQTKRSKGPRQITAEAKPW